MKRVGDSLKSQLKNPVEASRLFWHQNNNLEDDIEDCKTIIDFITSKSIKFKSNDGNTDNSATNRPTTSNNTHKSQPKKRGRPTKVSTVTSEKARSDSSDCLSLNDSVTSSSSTRSRRVAAQAAEHKLAKVQSLSQLNTKLRRPTEFDEKQMLTASPPAKCRRTRGKQSAGSSSPHTDEVNGGINGEPHEDMAVENIEEVADKCLQFGCKVNVEKLNTPTIKSFTHSKTRSSRSLERTSKGSSKDIFNESVHNNPPNSDPTHKANKKKSIHKTGLDSGISSTEEELKQLMKANLPIAHSSPFSDSFENEFKGFDEQLQENKSEIQAALGSKNTFVVAMETMESQTVSKKIFKTESQESSCEEIETTNTVKSRTKVLKKRALQTTVNVEEKENLNRGNETHVISDEPEDSPNLCSRTKVLKKTANQNVNNFDKKESSEDSDSSEAIKHSRTRTRTIRKHTQQYHEVKSDEINERSIRPRTRSIKKNSEKDDQSDSTDHESGNKRSRTKTLKKGTTNTAINVDDSEYLISDFKVATSNKTISKIAPISPAPAKGELVKKRVEDFEKMQSGTEEVEEEKTVGRVTRNAVKNKGTSSAVEAKNAKKTRAMVQLPASLKKTVDKGKRGKVKEDKENLPTAKLHASALKQPMSSERSRMTPLGVNNRMTPASDSTLKTQANKWTNSANRVDPVETNNVALIHKQATEEAERKKKEEERMKRQAKEEEAKKKKEKVLKATTEELKRKRVEKLQKVAAAREAAEKEKERLAAKAEKEKEEKMRQIALEKEKQREEQQKKKQLMLQKTLEHEERRKLEEAARLAKLKEQEEEHKRLLAMKEREQELLKIQKAEARLAEAEKTKHQAGKLGKIAAMNNAKLKMQGKTPSDKTNNAEPSTSYEITPAREDRPLLQPKTENDYGIDDADSGDSSEDEDQPKKVIPAWAQSKNRERLLLVNKYIPKKLWDMFMQCDQNPDINQIFAGNPIKKRVRTSSAVWRTPPK